MKKIPLLIPMLLVIILIPAFAEGQIGLSVSPEWCWLNTIDGQQSENNTGATNLLLTTEGANYFGKDGGFGIEYGLGVSFSINKWAENVTIETNDDNAKFVFKAGLGYRHAFSDSFGIVAGIGINGYYASASEKVLLTIKASELNLSMYGKIAADFTITDFLRFNIGTSLGGSIYHVNILETSASDQSSSIKSDKDTFFLAPFVGLSYIY